MVIRHSTGIWTLILTDKHGDDRELSPLLTWKHVPPSPLSMQLLLWEALPRTPDCKVMQARCVCTVQQSQVSHGLLFFRPLPINGDTYMTKQTKLAFSWCRKRKLSTFPGGRNELKAKLSTEVMTLKQTVRVWGGVNSLI